MREWVESMIFAVFAAAFIRMFLIEAYTIPTSSMEDSLLVGDYLFVSKVHYGMRTPMTVIQFPLLHNRIPILNTESYLTYPQLPYYRFPPIEKIDRSEPVVFNWPVGDSVFITPTRTISIGQAKRMGKLQEYQRRYEFVSRPLDKTDFYIKRCVAEAGDTLEIKNREVYINGQDVEDPENLQYTYIVDFKGKPINTNRFSEWNISSEDVQQITNEGMVVVLTDKQKERIQSMAPDASIQVVDVDRFPTPPDHFFPHDPENFPGWNYDNFGPIYIPQKGATVAISHDNIALYERIIRVYENNELSIRKDGIYINGEKAEEYTFKWDYFWMMGDNRHNSEDSRIWGFVPETHIVGKPLFIFFSTVEGSITNGVRWNRIFKSANIGVTD
jgi:signal peptidase I